jgi:hypothetical protein
MEFFLEILIVCLILFLYWIFVLAKDDFILLRKNVTLEHLFNLTFITLIIGIIFARIFYVLGHLNPKYLDPLVLILFPYFPGLSLSGGIIGGISFIAFRSLKRKIPFGRIFDIFSLSFFFVWPIGVFLVMISDLIFSKKFLIASPISIFLGIILFAFSFWLFAKNKLQDGSMGYICFSILSLIQIGVYFLQKGKNSALISLDNFLFLILFIIFLSLLIKQEKMLSKIFKRK